MVEIVVWRGGGRGGFSPLLFSSLGSFYLALSLFVVKSGKWLKRAQRNPQPKMGKTPLPPPLNMEEVPLFKTAPLFLTSQLYSAKGQRDSPLSNWSAPSLPRLLFFTSAVRTYSTSAVGLASCSACHLLPFT